MNFLACLKLKYILYFSARRDFRHVGTDVSKKQCEEGDRTSAYLSVRRNLRMGKNWLRSAMTICGGTLEYIWAGVHSHKCQEVEPA